MEDYISSDGEDEYDDVVDMCEDDDKDPDWTKTPLLVKSRQYRNVRRKVMSLKYFSGPGHIIH